MRNHYHYATKEYYYPIITLLSYYKLMVLFNCSTEKSKLVNKKILRGSP